MERTYYQVEVDRAYSDSILVLEKFDSYDDALEFFKKQEKTPAVNVYLSKEHEILNDNGDVLNRASKDLKTK